MTKYDYYAAVVEDVKNYIDSEINLKDYADRDELEQYLNDALFCSDSVTGNASGSYTFNSWRTEEYLCHNLELLAEALNEFGCDFSYLERGAEACDVTIRCYLLGGAISSVLDGIDDSEYSSEEDEEDEE